MMFVRVLGVRPPEVHVGDVVRLGDDALGESERLERLDAARLDAVGLTQHEPAVAALDDARRDVRELRQLRREQHAGGAGADDEHVHLVGELGGAVDAGAGGVLDAGLSGDVSVVVELHGVSSSDGDVEVLATMVASRRVLYSNTPFYY